MDETILALEDGGSLAVNLADSSEMLAAVLEDMTATLNKQGATCSKQCALGYNAECRFLYITMTACDTFHTQRFRVNHMFEWVGTPPVLLPAAPSADMPVAKL